MRKMMMLNNQPIDDELSDFTLDDILGDDSLEFFMIEGTPEECCEKLLEILKSGMSVTINHIEDITDEY
jgi:alkanesulfonate monooxygenase SsuD/methylene tetrahydromethanopterin reductase-like flavin-dependent oxidoreductase (luciferase family)